MLAVLNVALEKVVLGVVAVVHHGALAGPPVDADDVPGNLKVPVEGLLVLDDEDEVKPTKHGGLDVDVLLGGLQVVVPAGGWVGRGQDGGAGVEHRGDASLGDGDGLLLHGLVDGNPVLHPHLIELVDADDAAVGEHHGPALQVELPRRGVLDDRRGETGRTGALAGRVHGDGRDLLHKLEELRFGSGGISEHQHVDVTPDAGAVGEPLPGPAEEQARDSPLDVGGAEDGRRDAAKDPVQAVALRRELPEVLLLLQGECRGAPAAALRVLLQADHPKVGLADRKVLVLALLGLHDAEDSHGGHPRAWNDLLHEVPVHDEQDVPRQLSGGDVLRALLKLQRLLVHILGAVGEDHEGVQWTGLRSLHTLQLAPTG
mmetsp:Transcript_3377/g.10230  ORF Transcript_3377/g.10230 Transcript_3377/m.10230 type:complete len:373 (-) Transcript_3377:810-1928(-)